MTKNILLTEIKRNDMGLDVKKLLCEHFSKEEVQDALRDIGEPTSGTKEELVDELSENWESFNRDKYELLDFVDEETLQEICYYHNLDATLADHNILKRRIKKAKLLDSGGKSKPSSMVDDSRFYSKKPENKADDIAQTRDVHFHFGSVTPSRRWLIGIAIAVTSIIVTIIFSI